MTKKLIFILGGVVILLGGILVWQFWPGGPSLGPFSSPSPSPSPDETDNWKVYKNEKYGFEFRYPDSIYEYKEEEIRPEDLPGVTSWFWSLEFFNKQGDLASPLSVIIFEGTSAQETADHLYGLAEDSHEIIWQGEKVINGINWIGYMCFCEICKDPEYGGHSYSYDLFTLSKNGVIGFGELNKSDKGYILEEILSTFKFID